MRNRRLFPILLLCAASALLTSCSARRMAKKGGPGSGAAGAAGGAGGAGGAYTPPVEVTEASLRGKNFSKDSGLMPAYFDYDSFELNEETRSILKHNAEFLKGQKGKEALVAGHCDERGTVAYNLALGQKRAKEVREYYIRLGVPAKTLATISYGKESLVCSESNEECWGKNRRAETSLRSR